MRIGFTVGVWDLFHAGHFKFLLAAKKQCDYLVVGVMTDYWVKVQKGKDRPIQNLDRRCWPLIKHELADKIVHLDTLDMTPYLQMSDVWILGEDQENMRPALNELTSLQIDVVRLPRTPGISTTMLIGR